MRTAFSSVNDTRSALDYRLGRLETIKDANNQNVVNLFDHLLRQISALHMAATTSLHMQVDNLDKCTG